MNRLNRKRFLAVLMGTVASVSASADPRPRRKRFWAFSRAEGYPWRGGMHDFWGDFDDIKEGSIHLRQTYPFLAEIQWWDSLLLQFPPNA